MPEKSTEMCKTVARNADNPIFAWLRSENRDFPRESLRLRVEKILDIPRGIL